MKRFKSTTIGTGNTKIGLCFTSHVYEGKALDTKVEVGLKEANTLCWISGENIDKFEEALQGIINRYAI